MPESAGNGRDLPPLSDIELNAPSAADSGRPPFIKHVSAPAYQSPLRHHRRAASATRQVKETHNARTEYSNSGDDGTAEHRINQYTIKQEIGRGSFGAVHLAVDQYGTEYAVKEFSKSRLRKRAQSNLLRRPPGRRRAGQLGGGLSFNMPIHRHSAADGQNNSFDLIKEEIAIMKKLHHNNLVSLIEVLDDPEEDSLYMVMEMCKKGVVMHVSVDERADPYDEECCRCWFRDLILGIEYLHAQGVVHRDIKPDNCLLTNDDTLKIVDFGVSEMFEKDSDMITKKSAGSPAFMPPELCVPKHGDVSGKAADIWSMGVTLYCLRFGRIPFERTNVLDLYHAIRHDTPDLGSDCDDTFKGLMLRLLEKDPTKRITMAELREHPWVTKHGTDPLLSAKENTANIVDEPTEEEMNHAITGNMGDVVVVAKAVKRFKRLLVRKRPEILDDVLGHASRLVQPPMSMMRSVHDRARNMRFTSRSVDAYDRKPVESALAAEGIHREIPVSDDLGGLPQHIDDSVTEADKKIDQRPSHLSQEYSGGHAMRHSGHDGHSSKRATRTGTGQDTYDTGKGHAHDPLLDTLFLNIGPSSDMIPIEDQELHVVSESPAATEACVYELAYKEEVDRILHSQGTNATLFMTRRVEDNEEFSKNPSIIGHLATEAGGLVQGAVGGLAALVGTAKAKVQAQAVKASDTEEAKFDGS